MITAFSPEIFSCQMSLLSPAETSEGPGSCLDETGHPWFVFKGKLTYSVNFATLE
jgi:hypothetical protein